MSTTALCVTVVALAPFAWLGWYVEWSRAIRIGAGTLVLLFGVFKLVNRRHPRLLARCGAPGLNLDVAWGASLVLAGMTGIWLGM